MSNLYEIEANVWLTAYSQCPETLNKLEAARTALAGFRASMSQPEQPVEPPPTVVEPVEPEMSLGEMMVWAAAFISSKEKSAATQQTDASYWVDQLRQQAKASSSDWTFKRRLQYMTNKKAQ